MNCDRRHENSAVAVAKLHQVRKVGEHPRLTRNPLYRIFPEVDAEEPLETQMDMVDLAGMRNYEPVESQLDHAETS